MTVSQDPSAGVQLDSAAGEVVGVTIPQADDVDGGVRDEKGLIHFAGTPGCTTTVLPTDGGSQLLTSIADSSAPERFTYDLSLPEGAIVTRDEASGGVIAETPAGELLLLVAPPWAVDATGQQIDTTFEVTENSITQVVAHRDANTTYPVLADPTINGTLIKSYQWRNYQGGGRQISVHVTPAMGWATIAAAQGGWTELAKAVQSRSASEYRLLNTDSVKQQWNCHAYGKGLIWLNTVLGRDDRPSWDLETIRKPLRGNIVEGLKKMTAHQCNW